MAAIPFTLVSHSKKVCSLYKRSLRNLESYCGDRRMFRYHAVLHRARFEENRNVKDLRVAKDLLAKGEEELFLTQHYQPMKFARSPGGSAYQRVVEHPDWVLDYWHPLEKARYPEYFARREIRKKQFVEMWEKQYGKPKSDATQH